MKLKWKVALLCLLIPITFGCFWVKGVIEDVPLVTKASLISTPSSNIYATNGDILWSDSDNYRVYTPLEDVPETYRDMLLAVEDYEFYNHSGVNLKGLINAGLSYAQYLINSDRPLRGGSSIEQQLIKLSVFSTDTADQTLERKTKELFLAQQLDHNYDKDTILEFYLNRIYLGQNAYGAGTIAQVYFGKSLKDCTISQWAIIAGLGQAPSRYDLYQDPEAVKDRRDTVLSLAYDRGVVSKADYEKALKTPVDDGLKPQGWMQEQQDQRTTYYSDVIQSTLQEVRDLGYDLDHLDLQIHTGLDVDLYKDLKDIWDTPNSPYFQDDAQQAAATITDPKTGLVLAQIGGRFNEEPFGFNRATARNRSTGSTIKPFVVASFLDSRSNPEDMRTDHILSSSPYTYPGTDTVATNYGGVDYGDVTLHDALAQSMNTPMLRLLDQTGLDTYRENLNRLHLNYMEDLNTTHALGVDASSQDLAGALSALANRGTYTPPHYIQSLVFPDGSTKETTPETTQVYTPDTAYMVTRILEDVASPSGMFSHGHVDGMTLAAKTGTVAYPESAGYEDTKATDIWMLGYTKSRTIAIWYGYDQPYEDGQQLDEKAVFTKKADLFKHLITRINQDQDGSQWDRPESVSEDSQGFLQGTPRETLLSLTPPDLHQDQYNLLLGVDPKRMNNRALDPGFQQLPQGYVKGDWIERFKHIEALEMDRAQERFDHDQLITEEVLWNELSLEDQFGLPTAPDD